MRHFIILLSILLSTTGFSQDCIDPSLIDPFAVCPFIYDPVCGCDGITYSNGCIAEANGLLEWTPGECSDTFPPCTDLGDIDFGLCDMVLGVALVNGSCTGLSGCGYIVNEVDYSPAFFNSLEECQACEESNCNDLGGVDFGECAMPLGIALINNVCQAISGCTYVVNNIDYTDDFFTSVEDCLACSDACLDLGTIDFGPCDQFLGIALVNGSCTNLSGCGYIVNDVDYSNQFYASVEDCQNACLDCIDPSIIGTLDCGSDYEPVCGCNGRTYWNACFAQDTDGVVDYTAGPCSCPDNNITNDVGCFNIYDPVCGCDNVTYGNSCEAFYFYGITEWVPGECPNQVNEATKAGIKIYPNPSSGQFYLEGTGLGMRELWIEDVRGRLVQREVLVDDRVEVNVAELGSGVFVLRVFGSGGVWVSRIILDN